MIYTTLQAHTPHKSFGSKYRLSPSRYTRLPPLSLACRDLSYNRATAPIKAPSMPPAAGSAVGFALPVKVAAEGAAEETEADAELSAELRAELTEEAAALVADDALEVADSGAAAVSLLAQEAVVGWHHC